MTLQDIEAVLNAPEAARGLWLNAKLALAGDVTIDGEDVVATFVDGTIATLDPDAITTFRPASADDVGEAGRALWGNF